ncbi:hypothetical protein ACFZDG_35850 [Kitasatospora xanthocidica]|uniref:hypothetical protein n=1 Tax=Kitasatospora xanthocidica TaxID=83382 RepID=UPI0036E46590
MSSPSPRYDDLDILEETRTGRRLQVIAVGAEAYFVRRLDTGPGSDAEPLETAWVFQGCEDATVRIGEGAKDLR